MRSIIRCRPHGTQVYARDRSRRARATRASTSPRARPQCSATMGAMDIATIILFWSPWSSTSSSASSAIIVVPRNRRPTSGMAWLLAIFFIPYLGVAALPADRLSARCPRSAWRCRPRSTSSSSTTPRAWNGAPRDEQWPAWLASVVELNRNLGRDAAGRRQHAPPCSATTTTPSRRWPPTSTGPSKYVHVEFYILSCDHHDGTVLRRSRACRRARRHGAGADGPHPVDAQARLSGRPSGG